MIHRKLFKLTSSRDELQNDKIKVQTGALPMIILELQRFFISFDLYKCDNTMGNISYPLLCNKIHGKIYCLSRD